MNAFLNPADPRLKTRALEVPLHEIPLHTVQLLIDQMYEFVHAERIDSSKKMMGLAAPQIGVSKRIILIDMGIQGDQKSYGELKTFINPEIVWQSQEKTLGKEGCFSVDHRIIGIVPRHESIKIIAYDRYGNPVAQELNGFTARIFQHEIDHLDGIRFPDRIGEEGVLHWVETTQYCHYKKDWQNWPVRCSWTTWVDVKEGHHSKK